MLSIAALFIYLLLRSIFVPFLYDESATFFHYIHKGSFIPPYAHWDANNHILNSALGYFSYLSFGSSTFALRLPNLLTAILFFYYTYKIAKEISNKTIRWTFIITLFFAHNFIEFFALSRGYGMSMAFLFGAIYSVIQVVKNNRLSDYLSSVIFISLAILANLTLINTAIMLAIILSINVFISRPKTKQLEHEASNFFTLKAATIITLGVLLPIAALIRLLLEFKMKGLLYYGSLEGFWELSVNSFIKLLTQSENILIPTFILIYFISIIAILVYQLINAKQISSFWKAQYLFVALFLGNLVAILIMAYFLNINYPEDRTGIYFFPLFIGAILFSIDQISDKIKPKLLFAILLPFLFFPVHFIYSLNLDHSTLWAEESLPTRFIQRIADDSKEKDEPLTIGGYRMRLLTVAYQNYRLGGELNQIQGSHYPEYLSDYQIVIVNENEKWLDHYSIEDYEASSNLSLLKRKKVLASVGLRNINPDRTGFINKQYHNLYKVSVDTLLGETLLIDVEMSINSPEEPFIAWLVAVINDESNNRIAYEYVALDWKKTRWKGEKNNFSARLFLYKIPEESSTLSIYFWNIEKKEYELKEIEIIIDRILKEK